MYNIPQKQVVQSLTRGAVALAKSLTALINNRTLPYQRSRVLCCLVCRHAMLLISQSRSSEKHRNGKALYCVHWNYKSTINILYMHSPILDLVWSVNVPCLIVYCLEFQIINLAG